MRKYKDFMSEPDYGYIDIESCFDPIFEPPIDFLEECRKRWENRMNPFTGTVERKIGNTWYLLETVCDGNEPLTTTIINPKGFYVLGYSFRFAIACRQIEIAIIMVTI